MNLQIPMEIPECLIISDIEYFNIETRINEMIDDKNLFLSLNHEYHCNHTYNDRKLGRVVAFCDKSIIIEVDYDTGIFIIEAMLQKRYYAELVCIGDCEKTDISGKYNISNSEIICFDFKSENSSLTQDEYTKLYNSVINSIYQPSLCDFIKDYVKNNVIDVEYLDKESLDQICNFYEKIQNSCIYISQIKYKTFIIAMMCFYTRLFKPYFNVKIISENTSCIDDMIVNILINVPKIYQLINNLAYKMQRDNNKTFIIMDDIEHLKKPYLSVYDINRFRKYEYYVELLDSISENDLVIAIGSFNEELEPCIRDLIRTHNVFKNILEV